MLCQLVKRGYRTIPPGERIGATRERACWRSPAVGPNIRDKKHNRNELLIVAFLPTSFIESSSSCMMLALCRSSA